MFEIRGKNITASKVCKGQNDCNIGRKVELRIIIRLIDLSLQKIRKNGKENYSFKLVDRF